MKLERLYLVRRDHREIFGPMDLQEFQQRLERMEFGLQDEISGHCGPWIILDHKDDMTKHYPQVADALGSALSLSWREATGHARVVSKQDLRKDRRKQKQAKRVDPTDHQGFNEFIQAQQRKSKRMQYAAVSIVAISVLVAALILGRKEDVPASAEYVALANKASPDEFLNAMGLRVIPYPQKYLKTPKHQNQWLPLFRMYAFYTTGSVDGVPPKMLRGEQPATAPLDCSVDSWKQRWRESAAQTVTFVQGKTLSKNQWTKILALDPNWVRRRPSKGWIKPRNYFEGCMMTASVALRSLSSDPMYGADPKDAVTPDIIAAMIRRLQSQLEIVSSGRTSTVADKTTPLGVMTCLESAASIADLDSCRGGVDLALKPLMDEKFSLGLLKVVSLQSGNMDPRASALLPDALTKIDGEDQMSRLDLTPEYRFLSYLTNGNSIEQSLSKVDQEFAEIKFR